MRIPPIPADASPAMRQYLIDLSRVLDQEMRVRIPHTQGVAALLLVSPAKKVYTVQVDDSGTLSTTLVQE